MCVCVCVFVINGGILAEKNSRTERKEIRNPFDIGFFFLGKTCVRASVFKMAAGSIVISVNTNRTRRQSSIVRPQH